MAMASWTCHTCGYTDSIDPNQPIHHLCPGPNPPVLYFKSAMTVSLGDLAKKEREATEEARKKARKDWVETLPGFLEANPDLPMAPTSDLYGRPDPCWPCYQGEPCMIHDGAYTHTLDMSNLPAPKSLGELQMPNDDTSVHIQGTDISGPVYVGMPCIVCKELVADGEGAQAVPPFPAIHTRCAERMREGSV